MRSRLDRWSENAPSTSHLVSPGLMCDLRLMVSTALLFLPVVATCVHFGKWKQQ